MNSKIILVFISIIFLSGFSERDPTKPPGQNSYTPSVVVKNKALRLQGLIYGDISWVVINNTVIKEGQTRHGIKVIRIKANKVLLMHNNKKQWLNWQTTNIRKSITKSLKQ